MGTGIIWLSGEGEKVFPYFAPNYWQRAEIKRLVDPNPYFESAARPARARPAGTDAGSGRGLEILFALLFMALIGGGMVWGCGYLHDHGAFKPAPAPPANASVPPHGMGKVIDRTK